MINVDKNTKKGVKMVIYEGEICSNTLYVFSVMSKPTSIPAAPHHPVGGTGGKGLSGGRNTTNPDSDEDSDSDDSSSSDSDSDEDSD